MASQLSFSRRLLAVLIPTFGQGALSLIISLAIIAGSRAGQFLPLIGVNATAVSATSTALHARFDSYLTSQLASMAVLITFWAGVGLVAYLVCWAAYNALVEARNEVTLKTQYTNRGHWRGPLETLALKAVGAVTLVIACTLIGPSLALWLTLSEPVFVGLTLTAALYAALAVLGLAAELYLILALVILTITPWYRAEAFTDR